MMGTPCDVPLPKKMNENAMCFSFREQYHIREIRRQKTDFEKRSIPARLDLTAAAPPSGWQVAAASRCEDWLRRDPCVRACLKMWRRASRPAAEGGILPPEPSLEPASGPIQPANQLVGVFFRGAGSPALRQPRWPTLHFQTGSWAGKGLIALPSR